MVKFFRIIFTISFLYSFNILSMIDNRFLPLYRQMYNRSSCKRSASGTELFVMFGNHAFGSDDKDIGIPEINGQYDIIKIGKSLELIGKKNPFSTQFRVSPKLELELEGKLGVQGLWLGYEQNFYNNFSFGLSFFIMHLASKQRFAIPKQIKEELKLTKGNEIILDKEIREGNELLGLNIFQFSKTSPSDIDIYLRYAMIRDYIYKFRKIDAGISLGFLFPAGQPVNINNPASIPFGGDGHFGIYGLADVTFELKEDLSVGLWFEVLKRFSKNQIKRMPINNEPLEYGAVVGEARINPGITIGFSPFIALEDIRDGFGFKVRYTLVFHAEDDWKDLRKEKKVKTDLDDVIERSKWSSEYFIFTLMYDFAKGATKCRKFAPIIYLEWYRPSKVFLADRSAKTNRVSFGFEFNF